MDKKEEKMKELRRQLEDETVGDEELLAIFQEIEDYEASVRPAGTHWPENLICSILGLKWVELKKSGDGASVEEELSELLDTLTPREGKVIELFYKDEKGLIEIGQEFNVSYTTIRSILAEGSRKLRQPARAKWLAVCVAKSEPVIRPFKRTLEEWTDDPDTPDAPDDIFKDIFDDPGDEGGD